MTDEIKQRLVRYIDDYGWGWGVVKRQINGFFGTDYTIPQLKEMYKRASSSDSPWRSVRKTYL